MTLNIEPCRFDVRITRLPSCQIELVKSGKVGVEGRGFCHQDDALEDFELHLLDRCISPLAGFFWLDGYEGEHSSEGKGERNNLNK